jgi:serine/threonine-protein kinase
VYAGENLRVKRTVAIKILHAAASAITEMTQRFEREAQAAGTIGNNHIAEVYDLGTTAAGERYMVMEYLEGDTMRSRIRRSRRLDPAYSANLVLQLLEGLAAAHKAGIIHRDMKPDNIFIVREWAGMRDFVKILDFGISKFTQSVGEGSATRTGTVMGSPNYMSPEHVRGTQDVDARSDLYSVGVILYESVTGVVPRTAKNFAELLFKVAYEPLPDPRELVANLPESLVNVINKACASDPAQRFQNAEEFARALVECELVEEAVTDPTTASVFAATNPWASRSQHGFKDMRRTGDRSQPGAWAQSSPSAGSISGSTSAPGADSFTGPPVAGSASQAGSLSQAGSTSQAGSASQPGFGPSSPSWRQLAGPADGSQPNPNGTAILAIDSSSQPSFAAGNASQPGFGPPPQALPSFAPGNASQPSYSQGSVSTAAALAVNTGPGEPRRRTSVLLAAGAGALVGLLGLGGYVFYAKQPPPPPAAASAPVQSVSADVTAPPPTAPSVASADRVVQQTSAAASATAPIASASSHAASSSAAPSSGPGPRPTVVRPVRIPTQNKGPDPGY